MKAKRTKKGIRIRGVVQGVFFGLIAMIAVNHSLDEGFLANTFLGGLNLHGVCPFGGVVTLYQLVTVGSFVQKISASSVVLMVLVLGLAVLFGPVFCGWVCPLGTIQEWVGKVGKRIFKKRYNHFVPKKLDGVLRYLRFGVLGWVIVMTAVTGKLVFSEVDPYFALFNFWTGEVAIAGLVILGVTLVGALFVERPWCKYACPYGALLGLTNLFRVFSIRRSERWCVSCGLCSKECPMNIDVQATTMVRDLQCISCMECTSEAVCPVTETVMVSAKGLDR